MPDADRQSTTDVLVIGCGAAGAAAALTARGAGADVVLAERTGTPGGNCPYSGGFLLGLEGPGAVDHLDALCFGKTPRDVLAAFVDGLATLPGWLADETGGTLSPPLPAMDHYPWLLPSWPHLPGRASYRMFEPGPGSSGVRLWEALAAALAVRGVTPQLHTRAVELVQDADGTVTGAVLERDGAREVVHARGGVVLACGSFEGSAELRDTHLGPPLVRIGHAGSTGDSSTLAQGAGASLWHMGGFFGWFCFVTPEHEAGFPLDFHAPGFVYVDADGRRFSDETGWEAHDRVRSVTAFDPQRPNRPQLPLWAIFDETTRQAGALNGVVGTPNDHVWSADNADELARGWIARADDPAGLAAATGLPADTLTATLATYAEATRTGHDPEFGRRAESLVPWADGPLHAIEMWPGVATASGGPRRDAWARVVRGDGTPIPGLYAAGGAGSIWGHLTEHGGGLTDALVFGRLAGAGAATRLAQAPGPA